MYDNYNECVFLLAGKSLFGFSALICEIESRLAALAYFNSVAFNTGLKELIDLRNVAGLLTLALGIKEFSEIRIMQELIAVLGRL